MNTRNKFSIVLVVLLVAVGLSACAGQTTTQDKSMGRTLNVTGSAQAFLTPDVAYFTVGVHTENKDAQEAVASNNVLSQKVMDALKAAGVEAKDLRTSNFSIYPMEEWSPTGEKLGSKFVVDNTVYVTLRDLTKVGEVLGAAVEAGANSVSGITFDVEDKTQVLAEARAEAVSHARSQAEELAKAAGVELGEVQSISYYNSSPIPLYDVKSVNAAGVGGGGVPIAAGQMTLTVDVSITYEIK